MNKNTNIIDVNESEFNDQVIEASENKLIIVDFPYPDSPTTPIFIPFLISNDKFDIS